MTEKLGALKVQIERLKDLAKGKPAAKRSNRWPKVRAEHLKTQPNCQACGGSARIQVHHVTPFHLDASLELEPENLITLCESRASNCHRLFGHLLDYKTHNEDVRNDSETFRKKLEKARKERRKEKGKTGS